MRTVDLSKALGMKRFVVQLTARSLFRNNDELNRVYGAILWQINNGYTLATPWIVKAFEQNIPVDISMEEMRETLEEISGKSSLNIDKLYKNIRRLHKDIITRRNTITKKEELIKKSSRKVKVGNLIRHLELLREFDDFSPFKSFSRCHLTLGDVINVTLYVLTQIIDNDKRIKEKNDTFAQRYSFGAEKPFIGVDWGNEEKGEYTLPDRGIFKKYFQNTIVEVIMGENKNTLKNPIHDFYCTPKPVTDIIRELHKIGLVPTKPVSKLETLLKGFEVKLSPVKSPKIPLSLKEMGERLQHQITDVFLFSRGGVYAKPPTNYVWPDSFAGYTHNAAKDIPIKENSNLKLGEITLHGCTTFKQAESKLRYLLQNGHYPKVPVYFHDAENNHVKTQISVYPMEHECEDEGCPYYGIKGVHCKPKQGGRIATINRDEKTDKGGASEYIKEIVLKDSYGLVREVYKDKK